MLRKQNVLLNRVYYIALIIHQGISIEEECYKMLTECTMYESVRHFWSRGQEWSLTLTCCWSNSWGHSQKNVLEHARGRSTQDVGNTGFISFLFNIINNDCGFYSPHLNLCLLSNPKYLKSSLDNIFTSVRKCSSKKSQITYVSK